MVNMENYEEWMMLAADGELSEAEQQALQAFIKQHPELEKEWRLYLSAHLLPDEAMVYDAKDSLLKKETRPIGLRSWWVYAAAACLVMLLSIPLWKTGNNEETQNTITKVNTITNKPPITPVTPSPENTSEAVEQSNPVAKTGLATQLPRVKKKRLQPAASVQEQVKEEPTHQAEEAPTPFEETVIAENKTELEIQVPYPHKETIAVAATASPDNEKDLFAWLPVDEDKKKGLTALSSAITGSVEKVKEFKNKIKGTDVSVKIGHSELFVVKF